MVRKLFLSGYDNQKWLTYLMSFFLLASCGGDKGLFPDPFGDNLSKRVEAYYTLTSEEPVKNKLGEPKVYIDFSNGMYQAYTNKPDNFDMLKEIASKLNNYSWFALANDSIKALNIKGNEVYSKVAKKELFATEIMAPIEGVVKEITSSANDAMLITDFEEYKKDRTEAFGDFAGKYFTEWLSKGNSIDFFITNYQEKPQNGKPVDKHLYFIVFNYGKEKNLLKNINTAISRGSFTYDTFSLSTDFYALTNNYGGVKKGGNFYDSGAKDEASKNVLAMNENEYINGIDQQRKAFEFYRFDLNWDYLYKTTLNTPGFTDFFSKLYIDAGNDDAFQLKRLDVKVYDVTDDFVFFAHAQEAVSHKPKMAKDPSGNLVIAPNINDAVSLACYDAQGKLLDEWNYKPKVKIPIKEVFTLNTALFDNGLKNNKKQIEIGTKYHANFNGSQISNPDGLLRVDIVIADCSPTFSKHSLFEWQSITVPSETNKSLARAIQNTLDNVNPKGSVIYSYFIKANPDK